MYRIRAESPHWKWSEKRRKLASIPSATPSCHKRGSLCRVRRPCMNETRYFAASQFTGLIEFGLVEDTTKPNTINDVN
jgi:hypothetical protein